VAEHVPFSHLDADQHPTMVDVSAKTAGLRTATAESRVRFPPDVAAALRSQGLRSPKGPVFDTAIIAGVMAAKRTHELIPFCHPLGLENCKIDIKLDGDTALIRCTTRVTHKTGVEMEALTGASIAALTIYDMCKALSHEIVIQETRLISKHGGKSDFKSSTSAAPMHGLILTGGKSSRMHRDKAGLLYQGRSQIERAAQLLQRHVGQVFASVREAQTHDPLRTSLPLIVDSVPGEGPLAGIRSAFAAYPQFAWLVLACDLPFLSDAALTQLLAQRDSSRVATCFKSTHDGLPEPLCAIWEPRAASALDLYAAADGHCPRKFLRASDARVLEPDDPRALDNVNTPQEYAAAVAALGA
jgi:cyclic pyranopterin monophosphate synthase